MLFCHFGFTSKQNVLFEQAEFSTSHRGDNVSADKIT